MALNTTYPGYISIADSPENIIFGTVQVGSAFGVCQSAAVKRTADKEELDAAQGSLLAAILRKTRFELTLKTLFTADKSAPGIGERITFPLVGVVGHILDVSVDWENTQGRQLGIEATSWDVFDATTVAKHYNGSAWVAVADTVAIS